jgi:hypothetical protein
MVASYVAVQKARRHDSKEGYLGVAVSFYLGSPDGLEGLFWGSNPYRFRDWAYEVYEEYDETYSPEILFRLDRIVDEGPGSLTPADSHDAQIIDAIFDNFVGFYCDLEARTLLRLAADSSVYARRYEQTREKVNSRCSPSTSLCWKYLPEGRAVGRLPAPYPYTLSDEVFRLAYWTADEVRVVHEDLLAAFPVVAQRIRDRLSGIYAVAPDDEVAIEIAIEATRRALNEETGLIICVS